MATCRVMYDVTNGNTIILSGGKRYAWAPDRELKEVREFDSGKWLSSVVLLADGTMDDEHPFANITSIVGLQASVSHVMSTFWTLAMPRSSHEVRRQKAEVCETCLVDDRVFECAKRYVLMLPPPHETDLPLAPNTGRLGELFALSRQKFGEQKLPADFSVMRAMTTPRGVGVIETVSIEEIEAARAKQHGKLH